MALLAPILSLFARYVRSVLLECKPRIPRGNMQSTQDIPSCITLNINTRKPTGVLRKGTRGTSVTIFPKAEKYFNMLTYLTSHLLTLAGPLETVY